MSASPGGGPAAATASRPASARLLCRELGCQPYRPVWQAMRSYSDARAGSDPDQLWWLEHPPVFTLGQAGKPEHLLDAHGVDLVHSDRGGQVTYHGPGQLVIYVLVDLRRAGLGVRQLVSLLERSVVGLLAARGVSAQTDPGAPGVYVAGRKIAALGLRVRNGCSYHGLSVNVDLDLTPFGWINPCGYPGLAVTRTRDLGVEASQRELALDLLARLAVGLGYPRPGRLLGPPALGGSG